MMMKVQKVRNPSKPGDGGTLRNGARYLGSVWLSDSSQSPDPTAPKRQRTIRVTTHHTISMFI
jgi:hypothetical protein